MRLGEKRSEHTPKLFLVASTMHFPGTSSATYIGNRRLGGDVRILMSSDEAHRERKRNQCSKTQTGNESVSNRDIDCPQLCTNLQVGIQEQESNVL
jgi:hypothetical protein